MLHRGAYEREVANAPFTLNAAIIFLMSLRLVIISLVAMILAVRSPATVVNSTAKQESGGWDISRTASTLASWAADFVLEELPDISARVMSVREDGLFLDAGAVHGVVPGQVFEIYRVFHDRTPEEIAGQVQVAWTREDYCFCEPRGDIDLTKISELYFARIVHLPPALALLSDTSEGGGGPDLDRLLQQTETLISRRTVQTILGEPDERSWQLVLTPDISGTTLRASLINPAGDIAASILVDPGIGARISGEARLDPSYLAGTATPFEHYLAPPGRRIVRIAVGNIVPGGGDELTVLVGSDLWIYDLTGAEARLMSTLSVSIPPGPVRHREDAGSLDLLDLDDNGNMEICVSPPGGVRGELWRLDGDAWVLLGYIPYPSHAASRRNQALLVGPYLVTSPALDPGSLSWYYPLAERPSDSVPFSFSPTDIAVIPSTEHERLTLLATDLYGHLYRIPTGESMRQLPGEWGTCVRTAMGSSGPLALVTGPMITRDKLSIINPADGSVRREFDLDSGIIIDVALGDIDRDNLSEIVVAAIEPEGVRIYY
jgi:hypothetical protein